MPHASTQEEAHVRPAAVRAPKQFDRRAVPKALTGAELESSRVPQDEVLPLSVLTAQQVSGGFSLVESRRGSKEVPEEPSATHLQLPPLR